MTIPLTSPASAASAYARAGTAFAPQPSGPGFGDVLQQTMTDVVAAGRSADAQSTGALLGRGNLTEVVTAVLQAELAFQSVLAVRDRVVQAYQDVMRMPI